jgi:PAS domain S-box-containing protein
MNHHRGVFMAAELHIEVPPEPAPAVRVLLLEDSEIDAELVIVHLEKMSQTFSVHRVATRSEFIAALNAVPCDVVLADYSLPDFDGLTALDMVRERSTELPFIFVSGVVGEEFAINALRRGATDYVMKRGLNRLPAAVERALAEARERQERVRTAQALRLSETGAQLAVEAAGLGRWEYDLLTQRLELDARCRSFFGIRADTPADALLVLRYTHTEDRDRVSRALRQAMDPAGCTHVAEECRVIRRTDGQERWLSLSGKSFFEDGQCTRFIGVVVDITERKQAEAALQEMNQTLKLRVARQTAERDHLWQLSQDLLAVLSIDGRLIEVNPAWTAALGYQHTELIGESLTRFVHPDSGDNISQAIQRAMEQRLRPFESRLLARDGSYRWIAWSAAPGHGCVYVIGRDVTEDREANQRLAEAQEALRQSQKMEAVGQLTGGVAHDFNNLLQVVVGNIETLQRKLPDSFDRLRRAADNAMAGAQRAVNLTQHLLAFSRRQPLDPQPLAINKLVGGMSDMLQRTLGELIEIETRLDPQLWYVEIDGNQLESALLNLAVNARDAMSGGGKLAITTSNVHHDTRDAPLDAIPQGDYVLISVDDIGIGMTPDVLARVFEPFFTTKSVGHGTGLGLSQVYGFVKQSGGQIKIDSTPGKGTSIRIFLPRLVGAVPIPTDDEECSVPVLSPVDTVLVVEDDPDVRAYTVDTVRELGYQVREARDGPSALKVLQTEGYDIDLLFTDVVLPGGMNGHQLAQQAQELHPRLKVLFATGYARDVIVHHGRIDPGLQVITKPFSFRDLAAKLRTVLEGEDGARRTY